MMRVAGIFVFIFCGTFASRAGAYDEEIFSCNPGKNFERKVNELIYEKTNKYDELEKNLKMAEESIMQWKNTAEKLEKEVEEMKDCPKSGQSGVYTIYGLAYQKGMKVYCDTNTDSGGWIVFQLRKHGKLNFDRDWEDYERGFGELTDEFWLGLKPLRNILSSGQYELRVDLEDWEGNEAYATYSQFSLSSYETNYTLTVSGYGGTAGDALDHHSGAAFTTKDRDHDSNPKGNCAKSLKGGWWFTNCNLSHLNGKYYIGGHYSPTNINSPMDGASWYYWKNTKLYSMRATAMKIRRKS